MDQVSLRGRSIIERPTKGAGGRIRRPNVRERLPGDAGAGTGAGAGDARIGADAAREAADAQRAIGTDR